MSAVTTPSAEAEGTKKRILVIEDEPDIVRGLRDALEFEGFAVVHAKTGREGVGAFTGGRPDCVILDLMLPDMNGYQVCQEIRRSDTRVPIIMLTARSQEADKIRGLDAGADDYVTKPFSVGELVARIRAIFRRTHGSIAPKPITIGDAVLQPAVQTLVRGNDTIELSFYEVKILELLHERAGQPVTRDEILDRIWGIEASPTNRTVDNFIVKLRKKIEPLPDKPQHIVTVYGVGYKLVL